MRLGRLERRADHRAAEGSEPEKQAASLERQLRAFPEFTGHWAVLSFLPQGNNPHCVMESRRFQSRLAEFDHLNVKVIGVSVDSEEKQKSFRSMCALEFLVVSDANHEISLAYGVLETQQYEGNQVTCARREMFLIDPHGQVAHH